VDPDEPYTLAMYQDEAYAKIEQILGRGKVPVLAGGTPLYVVTVLEGWEIPRVEPDVALRSALEAEVAVHGPERLHARLAELDAAAAAKILPSNTRRIIRALEVVERTGQPISGQQGKTPPPFDILQLGLTCDRSELYRRVDQRVESQFARGLVEEVQALHERGYSFDLPSMSGLGYRQVGDYLMGRATRNETVQRIKWDTHAFVRHQGNWFRRLIDTKWIDTTDSGPNDAALREVSRFLGQNE
jgi:tRNA dimethylallyltransferase